ncbi:LPS-assembly protein LptD [Candidatus Pelagibacter sp. HIMB1483]|uniref:LPS-assembly protein LptD n=1 Tax=Candidatus Pelagibacter sp. HIMB1483 TaxID=3415414 RepID=UPI003F87BC6E
MLNKISIFIIIILSNLFFSSVYGNDQLNFDISQIEILDKGNKIVGKKRGKITTNDGITIDADQFEYDKIKNILKASGNIRIKDEINNYDIYSENVLYSKKSEKIEIKGKSNSTIYSNYNFKAEDIIIYRNEGIISSNKNVTFIDKKNQTLFEIGRFSYSINEEVLKGEDFFINTKYNQPFSDKYFFKTAIFNLKDQSYIAQDIDIKLKKNLFGNKDNDPRFKGISSTSKNDITTISKGIFTSCKKNDSCPPWTIQADKVTYDKNKKQIYYDKAVVKVYDIPILYFPKFFHPGPTVKRQSGLLVPHINNSNILGSSIQVPYFHVISENKDLTFKPTFFDKDILMLQNEYRQQNKNSFFITDFNIVNGYKAETTNKKKTLTHFFTKYDADLNFEDFIESSLNISVQKVNNDTYLKVFDTNIVDADLKPESFDTLTSDIKLNLDHEKFAFDTGFISYEDLSKAETDRYQYVLPYYNFSKVFFNDSNFGSFNFLSHGDNILKDTNSLRSRMINNLNIQSYDFITKNGFKNNFNYYLKNTITAGKNNLEYDSSPHLKIMNMLEMQSSYPLTKIDENYVNLINTRLSLRINPSEMKNYITENRRINNDNIFNIDRLGLIDTIESGQNLTLGIDYKKEKLNDINKYFEFSLATVLRTKSNKNIPSNSTLDQKNSNYFGKVTNNFNENIKLNYEFSIDNNLKHFQYNSLGASISKNNFLTTFNFIEENGAIGSSNILENTTSFNFDDKNFITFRTRKNREIDLTEYYDLIYEYKNDCLVAGIKYNKTYYNDRDLKPTEDFMLSITLIPLTSIEQKVAN